MYFLRKTKTSKMFINYTNFSIKQIKISFNRIFINLNSINFTFQNVDHCKKFITKTIIKNFKIIRKIKKIRKVNICIFIKIRTKIFCLFETKMKSLPNLIFKRTKIFRRISLLICLY